MSATLSMREFVGKFFDDDVKLTPEQEAAIDMLLSSEELITICSAKYSYMEAQMIRRFYELAERDQ
jgi:hypothetical protein